MSRHRFATDNESLYPAIDMRLLQFYTSKRLDKKDSDSLVTYTITKRKISRAASPVLKLIRRRQAEKWEAREQLADIVLKPC